MYPYERYRLILNAAKEKSFVRIGELLKLTRISLTTLRNDIDYLYEKGKIKKIRGGVEFYFILKHILLGRKVYAVGGEEEAAGLQKRIFTKCESSGYNFRNTCFVRCRNPGSQASLKTALCRCITDGCKRKGVREKIYVSV